MKLYAIRPVRGISPEFNEGIEAQIDFYKSMGNEVYDPAHDTPQNNSSLQICNDNLKAIENCDAVLFMWDGKSEGCLFDLGMAFALGKKVISVNGYVPNMTIGKSFQNVVYALEEIQEPWFSEMYKSKNNGEK